MRFIILYAVPIMAPRNLPHAAKGYHMAYKPRRSTTRRATSSRRSYGSSSRTRRTSSSRRTTGRSTRKSAQTLKIVIEQIPATSISRPEGSGPFQVQASAPQKSKF